MKKTAATQASNKIVGMKTLSATSSGAAASEGSGVKSKRTAKTAAPLAHQPVESAATPPPAPAQTKSPQPVAPETPKAEAATPVRRRKSAPAAEPLEIPPILLEADVPAAPTAGGPGEKFSLGAKPPTQTFAGGELPESYGTKKLFLTARDPHWLYAHWDLTREQQNDYNALSTDGHLVLRIFTGKIEGHPAHEIHVHPESRHWFAHVERAGNTYAAELGYYSDLGKWMRIAVSSGTLTPPDAAATESEAEYATIPFEFPFAKLMQVIEEAVRDNVPLTHAIEELRRHGHPDLPRFCSSGMASVAPCPSAEFAPSQPTVPGCGRRNKSVPWPRLLALTRPAAFGWARWKSPNSSAAASRTR